MRTMYDAVDPNRIPKGADLVAGYKDGRYANVETLRKMFPKVVSIAVSPDTVHDVVVLDVESGDATPAQAVTWTERVRSILGVQPTVYCSAGVWTAVEAKFRSAGAMQPHYWIASWDGIDDIPAAAVAKQYKNGIDYDTSVVRDYWPGVDKTPITHSDTGLYIVRKGDTLSGIADKLHVSVDDLLADNRNITNPNLIYPGEHIAYNAAKVSTSTYTVEHGDTLSGIAASHGITLDELLHLNPAYRTHPNTVYPGAILKV